MVLSSIWEILGIDQTAETRLIKKAYSKKLKLTRPDEKPEEFQQLHFAYKSALQEARWLADRETDSRAGETQGFSYNITFQAEQYPQDPSLTDDSSNVVHDVQIENSELTNTLKLDHSDSDSTHHPTPAHPEPAEYLNEIDRILDNVETVLKEGDGYDVNSWKIVLESEFIIDHEFVDQLGLALLRRIARYYNNEEFKELSYYGISVDALLYLNSIFRWDNYEYDYTFYLQNSIGIRQFNNLKNFDEKYTSTTSDVTSSLRGAKSIKKIAKHNTLPFKYYYYGSHRRRFVAMIIDFLLVIPIVSLVNLFSEAVIDYRLTEINNFNQYTAFIMYLLGAWLFESSNLQATPGKRMLGLRVIKKNQGRLGYFHGLLRVTVFAATCIGAFLTALINVLSDGRFIHDWLTRSYVMDLSRTRKEQTKSV
jgi:uncharacterized RDD family membrane protein YckC